MKTTSTTESIRAKYPPKGTQPRNQMKTKDDWDEKTINTRENLSEAKLPLGLSEAKLPLVVREIADSWLQIVFGIMAIAVIIQLSSNALLTKSTPTVTPKPVVTKVQPSRPVEQAPTFNASRDTRVTLSQNLEAALDKSWVKGVFINEIGSVYIGVDRYEKDWEAPMIHTYVCAAIARTTPSPVTVVRLMDANQLAITEDLWKSEITQFNCTN